MKYNSERHDELMKDEIISKLFTLVFEYDQINNKILNNILNFDKNRMKVLKE
jgi:hypothetical protein